VSHSLTNITVHAVFATKKRVPYLTVEVNAELFPYMGGILNKLGAKALTIGGTADHVHVLLTVPPTAAVAEIMQKLKANSSRWLRRQGGRLGGFGWQRGYAAFSVSESSRPSVARYIAAQAEHHRERSFREELLLFLEKHGVAYDERFFDD